MKVIKRDGTSEPVSFDKVLRRIEKLCTDLSIDAAEIAQKGCNRIYDGVNTSQLDELVAQICSSLVMEHPDYGILASRIIISNHHKKTSPSFSETMTMLYDNVDGDGKRNPLISDDVYSAVMYHKDKLNVYIDYERDYSFDYFGFKTMEKAYLTKIDGKVVERPQHLFMRVALGIHGKDFSDALKTYEMMSKKKFVHATPTLFNAGTPRPQMSSCFLLDTEDSIEGIFDSIKECANISKYAGGIGINIHDIRAKNSVIRGTNGKSTGIVPMLRMYNNTARYVNQSGRRNGSIAVYLEPWHADIMEFLDMKKNQGAEEERARDLFYALWIPDLFMKRVKEGGVWSLMCPDTSKNLTTTYGDEFEKLYCDYEAQGKFIKQVNAQDVWFKILESQVETGTPYMLYKDSINRKSNQKNLGVIKSSNLCTEITEFTSSEETAVCNLASICLPSYITEDMGFDFEALHEAAKIVTKNLNKVIDKNFYPVAKARTSNLRHRPIGVGVQGLADTFALLRMPFESPEAKQLNRDIFETIYHAAVEQSMEISKRRHEFHRVIWDPTSSADLVEEASTYLTAFENEFDPINTTEDTKYPGAYSSFEGSPASQGLFQFDMWGVDPGNTRYDWNSLRELVKTYGMRNSLLLAPMPTASTAQIMGFNEAFEPFTSNLYKRKTIAGEFILVNKYLIKDLLSLGIWNREMKDEILINDGCIQNIEKIPKDIRELYKVVWEIKQRAIIDMAADRGTFVCQSQSMNLFIAEPDNKKLTSMFFYGFEKGLKTGMYYLRTKPRASAQKFTIDPTHQLNRPPSPISSPSLSAAAGRSSPEPNEPCMNCSA